MKAKNNWVPLPKTIIAHSILLLLSWSQSAEGFHAREEAGHISRALKDACSSAKKCKGCKKAAIDVQDATNEEETCQWTAPEGSDKKVCSKVKMDEAETIRCTAAAANNETPTPNTQPTDANDVAGNNQTAAPSTNAGNDNGATSNPPSMPPSTQPSASPSAKKGGDPTTNEPTVSPTAKKDGDPTTNEPTLAPTAKKGGDPTTNQPTLAPTAKKGGDPTTNEPTLAPTAKKGGDPTTNQPTLAPTATKGGDPTTNQPTLAPTAAKGGDPTTNQPNPSPNDDNPQPAPSDDEPTPAPTKGEWYPDDYEGGSIIDSFGKEVGGGVFLVILLCLLTRCCRSSADSSKSGLPTRAPPQNSILGSDDNTKYQGVATADEDDDPDEWGWEDDNMDTFEGDMELPNVATKSPSQPQTPVGFKPAVSAASPAPSPPSAASPAAKSSPSSSTTSGLTMPTYKKYAPAPKPQPKAEQDIFSEMGLAAKPKFSKSLGATKLPQDSWGDDDLDDLLDD